MTWHQVREARLDCAGNLENRILLNHIVRIVEKERMRRLKLVSIEHRERNQR